jgi:hypothetical protein
MVLPGTVSPLGPPAPALPTPSAWNGPARLAELLLRPVKENTSDVEAALDTSQRLTGTAFGRDPAILNGRRRGTKDFLGRGEQSPQPHEPRLKARAADPVEVFGAASRGYHSCRQTFDAVDNVRLVHPSVTRREKKKLFFSIPGCGY